LIFFNTYDLNERRTIARIWGMKMPLIGMMLWALMGCQGHTTAGGIPEVQQSVTVQVGPQRPDLPYSPILRERLPGDVQRLPAEVKQDLAVRGCRIPWYRGSTARNDKAVASGHFVSADSVGWAVVCHGNATRTQDVLVYSMQGGEWKRDLIEHGSFDPAPTEDRCESSVNAANPRTIRGYARAFAPDEPGAIRGLDHDGVDVGYCDKASIVYYYRSGRWLQLQGAD
jgi:hypothetical protein